jgi:hypothetical protein
MNGSDIYQQVLENRINECRIVFIGVSVCMVLLIALSLFCDRWMNREDRPQKPKTERKRKLRQKAARKRWINLAAEIILCVVVCVGVMVWYLDQMWDCTHDIEHESYITYTGDVEVKEEFWRSGPRPDFYLVFTDQGQEISISIHEFDLEKYGLVEGVNRGIVLVYGERSEILLALQKDG